MPPEIVQDLSPRTLIGVVFWSMVVASLFYIIGFSSAGWESGSDDAATGWIGLWTECWTHDNLEDTEHTNSGWFKATQSMMSLGLILLIGSLVLIFIYMFFKGTNKSFQLKVFTALDFAAVVFMMIGFIIFGRNHIYQLSWSFAFCAIGAGICVFAGILSIFQLLK